ncbi:Hypothetical protein NTJ_00233 [Nesidiocoris tenuis]|uniref:Uncharacterized protein n=2 Tax=Nesidiocoris tenuis TaxID=355587 RepID=A0ABN7A5G3_9HEMI|nr:Hypothetical protein NTJ_00233 [Nesidiocoris tenuis]
MLQMVALLLASFAQLQLSESRAYKVYDSQEDNSPDYNADFSKSLIGNEDSPGNGLNGFHFPDFFNNGRSNGDPVSFNVVSPFEEPFSSQPESRSGDTTQYVVPAGTYKTQDGGEVIPHYREPSYFKSKYHKSKKPITSLYDDWTPEDEKPRSTKWSQEHVDDDSIEQTDPEPPTVSKPLPTTRHGYGSAHGRPYSQASVKQHYTPIKQIGGPHTRPIHVHDDGGISVHQHKYGVNHEYVPEKNEGDEPEYDYRDNLRSTKPQQFTNTQPRRNTKVGPSSGNLSKKRFSFKPSPPDHFLNTKDGNFDYFFGESTKRAQKIAKVETPNDQLHPSCVKKKKSTVLKLSDAKITMQCYQCYDKKHRREYEKCIEVSNNPNEPRRQHARFKREIDNSSRTVEPSINRGKRQYEDYYDGAENYGPDSKDYRFGPEHFTDDYPSNSYDEVDEGIPPPDSPRESEKCHKTRKGDMLCITCENSMTSGTYQQCSYASDPKKNSYERSISKTYGSPRYPQENRRKQVEYSKLQQSYTKNPTYNTRSVHSPGSGPGSTAHANPGNHRRTKQTGSRRAQPLVRGTGGGSIEQYRGTQRRSPVQEVTKTKPMRRAPVKIPPTSHPARDRERPSLGQFRSSAKLDGYQYTPKYNPPAANRAYSTPPPVGPDPYVDDIPDPYSPTNPISPLEDSDYNDRRTSSRSRKNVDVSFDPGYDETFAGLFPDLADTDPVILAPPSYDEYTDGDYDDLPERRKDVQAHPTSQDTPKAYPMSRLPTYSEDPPPGKRSAAPVPELTAGHRNRTCKKVKKNKMTCIQCIDESGSKHEDCSYVRGVEPKTQKVSYREVKESNFSPSPDLPDDSTQVQEKRQDLRQVGASDRGKRKFKKYDSNEHEGNDDGQWRRRRVEGSPANSQRDGRRSKPNPKIEGQSGSRSSRAETREKRENSEDETEENETSTRSNYNPIPSEPPELRDSDKYGEKGEFSDDTEPKYDPVLGLSLPKYMVEKSEHEAIFDEVLASGR